MDAALADAFSLSFPEGIVVTELHSQSPLRGAGPSVGDVILSLDNAPVNSVP
jgi:S1-C subfamily serine protease